MKKRKKKKKRKRRKKEEEKGKGRRKKERRSREGEERRKTGDPGAAPAARYGVRTNLVELEHYAPSVPSREMHMHICTCRNRRSSEDDEVEWEENKNSTADLRRFSPKLPNPPKKRKRKKKKKEQATSSGRRDPFRSRQSEWLGLCGDFSSFPDFFLPRRGNRFKTWGSAPDPAHAGGFFSPPAQHKTSTKKNGESGLRSPYLSHAKRAIYQLI
jgi:hypothetical protein